MADSTKIGRTAFAALGALDRIQYLITDAGIRDEDQKRFEALGIEVIVAISNPRLTEVYPETFVRNLVLGKEYFRRHAPGIFVIPEDEAREAPGA